MGAIGTVKIKDILWSGVFCALTNFMPLLGRASQFSKLLPTLGLLAATPCPLRLWWKAGDPGMRVHRSRSLEEIKFP